MTWILASSLEEILPIAIGLNSTVEIWAALEELLGTTSQSKILQLQMQFQSLKIGNQSISLYLRQAKLYTDELATSKYPIPPQNFNYTIYNNIGDEYSEVVSQLSITRVSRYILDLVNIFTRHEVRL